MNYGARNTIDYTPLDKKNHKVNFLLSSPTKKFALPIVITHISMKFSLPCNKCVKGL